MDTLIQADIFFFIATIALALLAGGFGIAIFYFVKILHDVREISTTIKTESKHLAEDLEALRANARRGMTLATIVGLFKRRKNRSKKKTLTDDNE